MTVGDEREPTDSAGGGTVVVLGAGLSKAVNSVMPITDELGNAVLARLTLEDRRRAPVRRFRDGRFEEWLSYLSEPQPQLSDDRVLEARALLLRVTRAMRQLLAECQLIALRDGAPEWFEAFVTLLHVQRAAVITLNYDNFVECAVSTFALAQRNGSRAVDEEDLLQGLPPPVSADAPFDPYANDLFELRQLPTVRTGDDTLRLLKLHGSLSWFWTPGDPTGMSVQRCSLPGRFGEEVEPIAPESVPALFGREPYIVPPAAAKTTYLQAPLLRELWRRADVELRSARRIVLVGYSVPQADQSLGGLLSDALRGRTIPIEVVDLKPRPVAARLAHLLGRRKSIAKMGGDDAVVRWVDTEQQRAARVTLRALREAAGLTGDELLYVGGRNPYGVVAVRREGDDLVVEPNPPGPVDRPKTTDVLLELAPGASRLVVSRSDGRLVPIVHYEVDRQLNRDFGALDQVRLVPLTR